MREEHTVQSARATDGQGGDEGNCVVELKGVSIQLDGFEEVAEQGRAIRAWGARSAKSQVRVGQCRPRP